MPNLKNRKLRILEGLLLCFLALDCLSIEPSKPIRISAPEKAPIQDISIEVLEKAYEALGYNIVIHRLPNVRSLLSSNSGKYDAEASRIKDIESNYPNLISVPTAVNSINVIALGNQKSKAINHLQDIQDNVLCVRGIKLVERLISEHGIDCSFVVTVDQALTMVSLGRADYALLPETNARITIKKKELKNIRVVSPILYSTKLYHYLHKQNMELLSPLNKVLMEMKSAGEISKIREDFLSSL